MAKGSRGGKLAGSGGLSGTTSSRGASGAGSSKAGVSPSTQSASGSTAQGATGTSAQASTSTQSAQTAQAQAQANQNQPQSRTSSSQAYENFKTMTMDEKAQAIDQMTKKGVPAHLADNDFQRFTYNMGINDKPTVVSDDVLDGMAGKNYYRTINHVYDSKNDLNYTPTQIANQIQYGRVTRSSDTGGSFFGRGLYFADNYMGSARDYGNAWDDIKTTAVIRMKLNSNAKICDYTRARNGAQFEINSRTALGDALSHCDRYSQSSIWALANGYNVIDGGDYFNVLDRSAITISSDVKATSKKGWK